MPFMSAIALSLSLALADPQAKENQKNAPEDWQQRFEAAYRLKDSEILKFVPAPVPEDRTRYYHEVAKVQGNLLPDWQCTIYPKNGKLIFQSVSASPGNLAAGLNCCLGTRVWQYDGDLKLEALRQIPLEGDWVIDPNSSPEARVPILEKILQQHLHRPIRLEWRKVSREVIVAKGKLKLDPLIGNGQISVYGKRWLSQSGGGSGTLGEFLGFLSDMLHEPIVDETESGQQKIQWITGLEIHKASTDVSERDALLRRVEGDTSLNFEKAKREIKVLWITESAPK
jgi:hypothetical protein